MTIAADQITITRDNAYMLAMSMIRMMIREQAFDDAVLDEDVLVLAQAVNDIQLDTLLQNILDDVEMLQRLQEIETSDKVARLQQLAKAIKDVKAPDRETGPFEVAVTHEQLQRIAFWTTAYALGRMTYIVSWQAAQVSAWLRAGHLTEDTIARLRELLEQAQARHERQLVESSEQNTRLLGTALGADSDATVWLRLLDQLRA